MARPNIILITADQLRFDCLGCAGNPDLRTPNLDALAEHGLLFSQAVCSARDAAAARTSLLTGCHAGRHGVSGSLEPGAKKNALPALLKQGGYYTAAIGRFGLPDSPADWGIDRCQTEEPDPENQFRDDYHNWLHARESKDRNGFWEAEEGAKAPKTWHNAFGAMRSNLPESLHAVSWTGRQAMQALRSAMEPFFLWISFSRPAPPVDPPAPWDSMYNPGRLTLPGGFRLPVREEDLEETASFDYSRMTEARFRKVLAFYYGLISQIDQQIGRILATLTARGVTNNLIVFSGIRGDAMGQHGLVRMPARPIEAALRIPLLVAGLSMQRRGEKVDDPTTAADIMPAILECAGIRTPARSSGKSLLPLLTGGKNTVARRAVTVDWTPGMQVLRNREWKLVMDAGKQPLAVYHLAGDPWECENLLKRGGKTALPPELKALLNKTTGYSRD
jgi:arylsulfatase